ncbi:MAG: lipopolysaccharide biosynthesis [Candidatus Solibacter sp.]|nr:lipopolysaccharide biosynthesis [Candidatus Solibacter sp.]
MRAWIRLAAQLYPRPWRERYGPEFDALLDDTAAGPREFVDVITSAFTMQLFKGDYWKFAAGMALAGVLVAAAISFALPSRYVSTATVPIRNTELVEREVQAALSRASLAEIIQRPSLDLYRGERARIPMEDVIHEMRNRDIQVRQSGAELRISYASPDPRKAQAVTSALATRFASIWPDAPPTSDLAFEVPEPASLPVKPVAPNRLAFLSAGLGAGVVVGLLAAASIRHPKSVRRLAGFAIAGCAGGVVVSFLLRPRCTRPPP